jgi:hypothetical protein
MSLLGHLVRATLAPEQAARPSLPQQFANWGGGGGTDDGEWGEASNEAPRPAPRIAPIYDDPFAAPPSRASTGREPELRADMPPPPAESPAIVAPSSRPAQASRAVEPTDEKASAVRTPNLRDEKTPAVTAPTRSAPRPEADAVETPPPSRRGRRAEVELPIPELARAASPPPPRVVDAVAAAIPVVAEPPRVIAPDAARAPIDIPPRPARHDPPAPVAVQASPAAPGLRRNPARLEEPRVIVPIAREPVSVPAPQRAAPLVAPASASPPVVAPILATPQVTLPDFAPLPPQLPDVHISIGRVEVRAAAVAPPRPAPRDTGKSETLSLDAYLSRRNGSAR